MTDGEAGRMRGHGVTEAPDAEGIAIDPVCGMKVDHGHRKASIRTRRPPRLLLLGALPREVHRRPGQLSDQGGSRASSCAEGHDLHLPDASPDPAGRARAAARSAAWRWSRWRCRRDRAERRADRHDPPLLDRARARAAGRGAGDGRACPGLGLHDLVSPRLSALAAIRARDAGRAVGRLAVLRARLGLGRAPQPQHVQPDRARHRCGLSLQPGRDVRCPAYSRRGSAAWTARSPSISRRRRSSPSWCCSARCWSCARASRPAARSGRCSTSRQRPRGG